MSSSQPYRSYPASSAQPFRSASAASSRPGPSSWLDIDPPLDLSALACAALDPSHLHEHDPDVQALYTTWSASRPPPPPYDASPLPNAAGVVALSRRNPWTTKAAAAWVLSQQLRDPGFEAYSLAQLIQHCGTAPFGPWHFIEARCPPGSSIRRFANHWVAWNASFTAGGSGAGEFAGLAATGLVARVVRGETRDPRTFELAHWFSACGDELAAKCDHDPVVRRRREWERARPPPKEKTPVVGRVDELKVQGRKNPVRSCWRFKRRLICSILFLVVLSCSAILAGLQIGGVIRRRSVVRGSNLNFTPAVVLFGLVLFSFVFCRWRRWFAYYCVFFNICAFANGVTWALDTQSCIRGLGAVKCQHVTSSAAFVLLSIPLSLIHLVAIRTSS